jgi:hypothetical protein
VRNIYAAFEVLLPQKAHEYDLIFAKKKPNILDCAARTNHALRQVTGIGAIGSKVSCNLSTQVHAIV